MSRFDEGVERQGRITSLSFAFVSSSEDSEEEDDSELGLESLETLDSLDSDD